ncbi:hypothetical protein D3C79_406640 [compost metagenome]
MHLRICRCGTGNTGAVTGHHHAARAFGQRCIGNGHADPCRGIASGIGLHQHEVLTCGQRCLQVNHEGAIWRHGASTDDCALGITHFDCGTRLTTARHGQAAIACQHVSDDRRCGNVRGHVTQRHRGIACRIGHGDGQGFAIGLGRVEGQAEAAIRLGNDATDQVARGIFDLNPCAPFCSTDQAVTITQHQVGWLQRCYLVGRRQRARCRDVAGGIGQGHLQGRAIHHRGWQLHIEAAIGLNGAAHQHLPLIVAHLHGGARFAAPGDCAAIVTDGQLGSGLRRCGVAAVVHDRCGDAAGRGGVACDIGGRHLQLLACHLWRGEADAEGTAGPHHDTAQYSGAIGGQHTDGAACFGAAADNGTVATDCQIAWRHRRGDVWCGDLHRQRRGAVVVDRHHVQQLAIGLGRYKHHGEGALGTHHDATDQRAVGIMHFHAATSRSRTADAAAIGGDDQFARAGRGDHQWHVVGQRFRGVAARVGLYQAQAFTRQRSRVEVDQESTVRGHCAGTDQRAIDIAHLDGSTGFAATAQGQAVGADDNVADYGRHGDVRGLELQG